MRFWWALSYGPLLYIYIYTHKHTYGCAPAAPVVVVVVGREGGGETMAGARTHSAQPYIYVGAYVSVHIYIYVCIRIFVSCLSLTSTTSSTYSKRRPPVEIWWNRVYSILWGRRTSPKRSFNQKPRRSKVFDPEGTYGKRQAVLPFPAGSRRDSDPLPPQQQPQGQPTNPQQSLCLVEGYRFRAYTCRGLTHLSAYS